MDKIVSSGQHTVVDSGSIISFNGEPISIRYKELGVTMRFVFSENLGEEPDSIEIKPDETDPLHIVNVRIKGFRQSFGDGTVRPMKFMRYEGLQFFLHFRIWSLADSPDMSLQYTVYRE